MNLQQASRTQAKVKMGIQGPSGSGKTYSSLKIAYGLTGDWNKICVVDSENGSSNLYSHLGQFNVLRIGQPFSPEKYIEAMQLAENAGMEVLILDSISHEWESVLDIHSNMAGNSFTNWSKVSPRHSQFVQKMLQSPAHIIATIRTRQDYVLTDKNGKMVPEKVGLKGVQRDGIDYEFHIVFDLDIKHNASASKDRTGLFMDKPPYVITSKHGERILNWCQAGSSLDEVRKRIEESTSVVELRDILKAHPEHRDEIQPLAIKRKEEIHANIINTTKISGNGTDKSK